MKFTDRKIDNLKAQETRYELWEGNGLGIRISTTGRKSWIMMYRFGGKARRLTLGTYPGTSVAQAHQLHGKAKADLQRGIDPGTTKVQANQDEREAATVQALAHEYIERWAKPRKRSWKEDQRILEKDVLPKWGRRKSKTITRRDVITLLDGIVDRGAPIQANRTFAAVRKMFNFAVSRDIVPVSPCAEIKMPAAENRKDRVLSAEEIHTLWTKLDSAHMNEGTRLVLKLQLTTAQRPGEVTGAAWDDINFATGWWTIPTSKAKNKLAHRVPLSALALEVLEQAQHLVADSAFVFPSPRGDKPMTEQALARAVARNLEVFGIEPFTPHDLRRTAASHMTSMGIFRLVVSKILNHADGGVTAVYDRHSYDQEKRTALEAWAKRLQEIVTGEVASTNVVMMNPR